MALLDEVIEQMKARRDELRPAVEEYNEVDAALAKLNGVDKAVVKTKPSGRRRGRPKGSGNRPQQVVALIQSQPGLTVAEVANGIGLKHPNYLYRVMPSLELEHKIRRDETGRWYPA